VPVQGFGDRQLQLSASESCILPFPRGLGHASKSHLEGGSWGPSVELNAALTLFVKTLDRKQEDNPRVVVI
jgi:hypothetical protein